ncbi:MAG: S8 family peptidase [Lachnospiraceae bacterium]|nr:S8 family peptidase [Lachnospiraceae bacterium]
MPLSCEERIQSNDYLDLIIDYDISDAYMEIEDVDACKVPVDEQYRVLYIERAAVAPISISRYVYQYVPKLYGLMQEPFNSRNLSDTGILRVQRPPLSLTGRGTVVAIIDTGIDYTEPVFRNPDGSTRILAIWDQTLNSSDYPGYSTPEDIPYGLEFTREDINRALRGETEPLPTKDQNGHGTAMASVAAGSSLGNGLEFLGAAPECDIVVIKLKEAKQYLRDYYLIRDGAVAFQENDIMFGIKYAQSFNIPIERPVVMCLGIGTNMGDHAGNSALDTYLNQTSARRGQAVVVCGGNEGNAAHHFSQLLSQNTYVEEEPYENVEIRVGEGEKGFILEMWGNTPNIFSASIRSPGGEVIPEFRLGLGQSLTYSFVYERTRITIDSVIVEQGSGDELITFRFDAPTPGVWNIRVSVDGRPHNAVFHMWLPITDFLTSDTYFLNSSPYTTLTEPSLTKNVLTTSTYDSSNNSFYVNSGRGYSRDNTIKPDVAAPGVLIPTIRGTRTGSSMGAALTAGAVAQFMEWAVVRENDRLAEGKQVKNYFIRGAEREDYLTYPNREWGYGRMNINGTFEQLAGID